jgi:hypothetical protein
MVLVQEMKYKIQIVTEWQILHEIETLSLQFNNNNLCQSKIFVQIKRHKNNIVRTRSSYRLKSISK